MTSILCFLSIFALTLGVGVSVLRCANSMNDYNAPLIFDNMDLLLGKLFSCSIMVEWFTFFFYFLASSNLLRVPSPTI